MARKKKQEVVNYTDEYFLHLTMKYDERDDNIYPKWASWCANSDDKYFIDGRDGYFYTHIRSEKEIQIEKKKHEIFDFIFMQRLQFGEDPRFEEYEQSYLNLERLEDLNNDILELELISFEDWKNK